LNGSGVHDCVGGDATLREARVGAVDSVENGGVRWRGNPEAESRRDPAAVRIEARWLDQLLVDEIDSVGQPLFHQIDLALVGAAARLQSPFVILARLRLADFIAKPVDQAVE